MSRRLPRLFLLCGCIVLFLALTLPRIGDLMGQDEASHYFKLTRLLLEKGWSEPEELITFSPHGYPLFNFVLCKCLQRIPLFCSLRLQTLVRLCGVVLWLITLIVVFYMGKGWLALPILAVFPAVCQSAVIVEIDQTALPLASLCLCLAFTRLRKSTLSFCLAALAMAAALWCRLTTPLVLCAPLLLFYTSSRGRGEGKNAKSAILLGGYAMLTGILLFMVSWWLYCHCTAVSFSGPFSYLVSSFQETTVGARAGGLATYMHNLLYLCLWGFNPFLLLLFLVDGLKRIKNWKATRCMSDGDAFWLCASTLFIGYTLVGGALFGFPKYQIPALPLMALAISDGVAWKDKKLPWLPLGITAVASSVLFALLPDALYLIRFTLRTAQATGTPSFNGHLRVQIALFILSIVIVLSYGFRCVKPQGSEVGCLFLVGLALGCNLAWGIRQSIAPYSTGYIYGDRGECKTLARLIRENGWAKERLCVPVEVVQCLGLYDTSGLRPQDAPDAETLADIITNQRPPVVALSPLISPVSHFRALMESTELQTALADYDKHTSGHLTYWTRRHENTAD